MAFEAQKEGTYWETNVSQQISFDSEWRSASTKLRRSLRISTFAADAMHDAVVREFTGKIVIPISAE